ncbi:hypothetical protein JST97_38310 [bacterium]|nr:hypothetical protein [bacterium]
MRHSKLALTFLEMVFALAVIFVGATAVTSLLIAGAGWPVRVQQSNYREQLTHDVMARMLDTGLPPTAYSFTAIPGEPRYESEVAVMPASFASNVTVVEVTVRGPLPDPNALTASLRSLYTKPDPVALFNQYQCYTCHTFSPPVPGVLPQPVGLVPPFTGPPLTAADLQAGMNQASSERAAAGQPAFTGKDEYIQESIRNPNASILSGFSTAGVSSMDAYPDVTAMPQADLEALKQFVLTQWP